LYNVRMDRYRGLINLFSALGGGLANNDVSTATDEASKPGSIDWTGRLLKNEETHWLVELSGVYDGGAVLPAWRDLSSRFPREIGNYYLLPQRQGQIKARDKERASWYRLFIGSFPYKQFAEDYCAKLSTGQQRCTVVSSESIADKGDFVPPDSLAQQVSSDTWDDVAAKTTTLSTPDSGVKKLNPLETGQYAVEVQDLFWLVAMSDVYYGINIAAAWRKLVTQFPAQMKNRIILPRREAQINSASEELDFGYKLFIAKFFEKQSAEDFCTMLLAGLQRCSVVSSQLLAEKEGVNVPLASGSEADQGGKP